LYYIAQSGIIHTFSWVTCEEFHKRREIVNQSGGFF
jgi:hypothetical protein